MDNIQIEQNKSYHHKTPILLGDVDIEKVWIFDKISIGKKGYKYVIGYLYDNQKVNPLHIMLPENASWNNCLCKKLSWTN